MEKCLPDTNQLNQCRKKLNNLTQINYFTSVLQNRISTVFIRHVSVTTVERPSGCIQVYKTKWYAIWCTCYGERDNDYLHYESNILANAIYTTSQSSKHYDCLSIENVSVQKMSQYGERHNNKKHHRECPSIQNVKAENVTALKTHCTQNVTTRITSQHGERHNTENVTTRRTSQHGERYNTENVTTRRTSQHGERHNMESVSPWKRHNTENITTR